MKLIKTTTQLLLLTAVFILLPCFVFASSTDGTINSTYKYAWTENAGWIDFGASNGNVHITDTELTGYGWGENIGWVSLNCSNDDSCDTADYKISNDGEGNLTGYGWAENTGWIDFSPAHGGVTINSNGEFSGYGWGENVGWIVFNCATTDSCSAVDYKVKTDWRPQTARPACNNVLDDDGDGLVDYPADLGCESLTDDNEINPGGGLPPSAYNPPTPPTETPAKENPKGGFNILINNGGEYTNSKTVELKLFGGSDTKQFAISQDQNFKNATLQPYKPNNEGFQVLNFKFQDSESQDTKYQIFAKFYTRYGQPSEVVSDTIILDDIPPEKPTIIYPTNNSIIKTDKPLLNGEVERNVKITLKLASGSMELINIEITPDKNGKWSYQTSHPLADGNYQIKIYAKDSAQNKSETALGNFTIFTLVFPPKTQKQENNESLKQENIKTQEQELVNPTEPTTEPSPNPSAGGEQPTESTEPIKPPQLIEPTEPTESLKQENIKTQEQEAEPNELVEPTESAEPTTGTTTEPTVAPIKPTEKPETTKTSAQQEIKKNEEKTPSLISSISNQIKQGIDFIANQLKKAGQTIAGIFGKLTPQKELAQEQEKAPPTPKLNPVPTPEPEDLPEDVVVIKSAYGNIELTQKQENIKTLKQENNEIRNQESKLIVSGLSNQEVTLFIKPQGDVLGVAGQILYNSPIAQSSPLTRGAGGFKFFATLKPTPAFAQNEETQTPDNISQSGGWKIKEFYYNDEDNDGIYKAQIKLPGSESNYTIRTLIAYEDGNIKSIDTPIIINSYGYVFQNTKEGMIRIEKAKITLFKLNEQTKQYEIFSSSSYNKENPQSAKQDGAYSFLAPKGKYYITVQAKGYKDYRSKEFSIKDGEPIDFNIELNKKFDWIRMLEFTLIILVAIAIVSILSIFFYARRAKRREK